MMGFVVYEHAVPGAVIWLGLVAALAVAAASYWRYVNKDLPTAVILAMRLFFLALLAWCLFMPGRKTVVTQLLKPRFVVAVDRSSSMQLGASGDASNRWARAMQAIRQPWTEAVSAECDIEVYGFADSVGEPLTLDAGGALVPDGRSTLLREALQRITSRYGGLNVAGGLLLSDGIDTREAYDDWAAQDYPFPLYTVLLESKAEAWGAEADVRVDTVNTPRRVTVGWTSELKVMISARGTRGQPIGVQLFRDGELHQERPTQVPTGGGSKEVQFELEHPETGVFNYRVWVPPLPGEMNTNDNEYAVSVQVITARNHLLYVEGPPRWESKYLTRVLRASQQMTPLIFLRGPGGQFMTFGERGSMTAEMQESQLAFFKIVILGNLDADELGEERARNLVKFAETGGSLILLGGSKAWGDNGFDRTALKQLLPVRVRAADATEGKFPVVLTDAGRSHPAFAGDPALWSTIPPVLSVFPGGVLSAGAQALVVAQTPAGEAPIIVSHRYGQGKVTAILTDSLWKWQLSRETGDHEPYRRFWDQLIAWMAPEEHELKAKELELFADREELFLGEDIEMSARLGGDEQAADAVAVTCTVTGPDGRALPFAMGRRDIVSPTGRSFPGFALTLDARQPGLHTAVASTEVDGSQVQSDPITFFVKPFTPETMPRPANVGVLQTIAERSGGRYFESLDELDQALSVLQAAGVDEESAEYRSLWQHWLVLACLMALLTVEWTVRKWQSMP